MVKSFSVFLQEAGRPKKVKSYDIEAMRADVEALKDDKPKMIALLKKYKDMQIEDVRKLIRDFDKKYDTKIMVRSGRPKSQGDDVDDDKNEGLRDYKLVATINGKKNAKVKKLGKTDGEKAAIAAKKWEKELNSEFNFDADIEVDVEADRERQTFKVDPNATRNDYDGDYSVRNK